MDAYFDAKTKEAIDNATRVCVLELLSTLKHDPEWIQEIAGNVINRSWDIPKTEEDHISEEIVDEIDNRIYEMLHDMKISVPHLNEPYRSDLKAHLDKKFDEGFREYKARVNSSI